MPRHEIDEVDTVVFADGRFAASVWINGTEPYLLLVNVAVERTVLMREAVIEDLGLSPFITEILPASPGGSPVPLRLYRLDRVHLGQSWLDRPLVAIADDLSPSLPPMIEALGVDGVLGMDWLRPSFDKVYFALLEQRIELWQRVEAGGA